MTSRRELLIALGAGALATPLGSFAQQRPPQIPRIGFLQQGAPIKPDDWRVDAFLNGMREFGYVDGKTMHFEPRWAEGNLDRLPTLAAELVKLNVDVIVTSSSPSVKAALGVTRTTPIVMAASSDPVTEGLASSFARPGGNVTGQSIMSSELGEKRLELLKEINPKAINRVAVLWNPASLGMQKRFDQAESAAKVLHMSVQSVQARNAGELEEAFNAIIRARCDAFVLLLDPMTYSQRNRIVSFAKEKRLPAIYEASEFVDAGGLISYGPNMASLFHRAAAYVDKILKGANPGDLPIEQPTKFDLVLNMKTAKELGIKVPDSIRIRAEKVIE